jgi:hypothetical protein
MMMRTDTTRERLVARQTLEEVMRKLEEALQLSRQLEAEGKLPAGRVEASGRNRKGVHG